MELNMSEETSNESPDFPVTGREAKLNAKPERKVTESEKVAAQLLLDASPPLNETRAMLLTDMKSRNASEEPPARVDYRNLLARKVSLTERVDPEQRKPDSPLGEIE